MTDIAKTGFELILQIDTRMVRESEPLIDAGSVHIALRMAGTTPELERYDRFGGNYLSYALPDGSCPVIEATLAGKRIGLPLGLFGDDSREVAVTIRLEHSHFSISVGDKSDEDLLSEEILQDDISTPRALSNRVRSARILMQAHSDGTVSQDPLPLARSVQYWSPKDHDAWVGDVVPCFFRGGLHIFYLFDRRHHGSKGGAGGHWFAHLSSSDLVHWFEHPAAVPIEAWWETIGTGTAFEMDGKLCLAYGLHTERISKDPALPVGATYAVSEDGIHFRKTGRIIHPTRNPTVYNRPDGSFGLAAGYNAESGLWTAARPEGPWMLCDATLPTNGDCPCPFEWNGHYYVLQGFSGMAHSTTGMPGTWEDWAKMSRTPYDGLSVPMVAPFNGNRRILAGWLSSQDGAWWGGWLVFRELVQEKDGTLGTKWVPEITPPSPPETFTAKAGQPLRIVFPRATPNSPSLVFLFDPETRSASFADDVPEPRFESLHSANNVRFVFLPKIEDDIIVRIVRHWDKKAGSTIFDAEIAGRRTLICRRSGQFCAPR